MRKLPKNKMCDIFKTENYWNNNCLKCPFYNNELNACAYNELEVE